MRHIGIWITALWVAFAGAAQVQAQSQGNPVVIELFTSQGCSSCPPADALLKELSGRDDVIPLALHVDYWDYIGWKDIFAQPKFTKRQYGYAKAGGRHTYYTPQMVINGQEDVVGSKPMRVADLIAKYKAAPRKVEIMLERQGGKLRIRARPLSDGGPYDVQLVRYSPIETVEVRSGENAGRKLSYSHVVRKWDLMDRWDGRGAYDKTVALGGDEPVVVLIQSPRYGPVVAAARLR